MTDKVDIGRLNWLADNMPETTLIYGSWMRNAQAELRNAAATIARQQRAIERKDVALKDARKYLTTDSTPLSDEDIVNTLDQARAYTGDPT